MFGSFYLLFSCTLKYILEFQFNIQPQCVSSFWLVNFITFLQKKKFSPQKILKIFIKQTKTFEDKMKGVFHSQNSLYNHQFSKLIMFLIN